jgi:NAD(P)-dependent dehydrogenase (short-subunit alcohol dehydrogenase family)
MKTIVITGSTRGIGYGLADAFLALGCNVVISGRKPEAVEEAAARLAQGHKTEQVLGQSCEVTDYAQVEALWDASTLRFGRVDIWINNAGLANILTPFWELDPQEIDNVVRTNVIGAMYGCKVAIRGMLAQGSGALYNMEGFGSRGKRKQPGLTLYGSTKAGMAFLDDSLVLELDGTPILFGSISPGMVVTDLLLNQRTSGKPEDWERSKQAFNILAERVEVVTPWLARRILENQKHGMRISYLNGLKVMWRFLSAPLTKRKVIDD